MTAESITTQNSQFSSPDLSSDTCTSVFGYKLVGDNVDISAHARYMRSVGYRNQSLHYFHSFAVLDRISFRNLSQDLKEVCQNNLQDIALSILPSPENDKSLVDNIAMLISRVLVTHMDYFRFTFSDSVTWHLQHKYYKEMSSKSKVVSAY